MGDLRELVARNESPEISVPILSVQDTNPDLMSFELGRWVAPPWPGMRCMLTLVDNDNRSRFILCEVAGPLDLGPHRHPGHVEEVFMMEGEMRDIIHDQKVRVGGRIRYPVGEGHWPVFDGPARFMCVFRQYGKDDRE